MNLCRGLINATVKSVRDDFDGAFSDKTLFAYSSADMIMV